MITVFADGSITGHVEKEHVHCWAAWYALDNDGKLIHHDSFDMGESADYSATTAEYSAIQSAMHWLVYEDTNMAEDFDVTIYSDSQVAIKQLLGQYECHSVNLLPYFKNCKALETLFSNVKYQWIPRKKNQIADILSKSLQTKYGGRLLTRLEVENLINPCDECDGKGVYKINEMPQLCICQEPQTPL